MPRDGRSDPDGTTEALSHVEGRFGDSNYAAVILAGGDGIRLSAFTREIYGHHIPKQFCPLFAGGETLLERTQRRVSHLIPPAQTIAVLNREHEQFYAPLLRAMPQENILKQPCNRGTAPAIVYALRHLVERGHIGPVAIFPSDHHVSDDSRFMRHVAAALCCVELSPQLTILLGVGPDAPETEYGWIEPGESFAVAHPALGQVRRIRRFWEKPTHSVARDLHAGGCLWNSFVLVADALSLLALVSRALPDVCQDFSRLRAIRNAAAEAEIVDEIFQDMPTLDFSARVVARYPEEFSVLPVTGLSWSDLGDPSRLLAAIASENGGPTISGGNPNVPRGEILEIARRHQQVVHKVCQSQR